ncbi:uncharacterized protein LOC135116556 [Helicoverpa armigera]|uniref:uncharacterized protein LOC135116556 n=1 Tax=Helicoverpa armigera TaxID=29058 RepID=UPI002111CF8E|nr:uncharacterized protein LOC110370515 isoform X5 [Helicoverpa armigera]
MSFLYVKAYYGPCNTFDTCKHKPQLLTGFRDRLQKLGFRIDLVPVPFINYFMLEMCGHEVFRCNLKHMKFNTRPSRDKICRRAIEAVMTSAVKFRRARAILWFWTALDHQMFRRSAYAPPDYWAKDIDMGFSTCAECIECCKILVKKRSPNDDKGEDDIETLSSEYSI